MKPMIDDLSKEFDVDVTKVDIEQEHQLASDHQVISIPTVIFLENGIVVDKVVGARAKQVMKEKFSNFSKN